MSKKPDARDRAAIAALAETLIQAGRPGRAALLLQALLLVDPSDAAVLDRLALALARLGRVEEAKSCVQRASLARGSGHDVRRSRLISVEAYLRRGATALARAVLRQADPR